MPGTADTRTTLVTYPSDTEILIERAVNAPPALVWRAFSNAEHLAKWWGPVGFTTTTESMSFEPGGQWRYTMHGPDGTGYPNVVTYLELDEPRRLVYRHGGETGGEPVDFVTEADFVAEGGGTRVTLQMCFPSMIARDFVLREYGAAEGGKQTLARLDAYVARLASGEECPEPVVFERVFAAPRELVWRAWTREDHLKRWFGPAETELTHCEIDLCVGGLMRYRMEGPDGSSHWARWVFEEISEPDRLVFVVSFTDPEGNPVRAPFEERWPLETRSVVRFVDHAGRGRGTLVRVEWTPLNASDEELRVFGAGREQMSGGWKGTFEQLGAFLGQLNA